MPSKRYKDDKTDGVLTWPVAVEGKRKISYQLITFFVLFVKEGEYFF
jgi:hypothetical protein